MKALKSILLLSVAVLALGAATASPVSPKRAATVARNFFNALSTTKDGSQLELSASSWQFDGIYLFTAPDGGFVLVAADDAARPILGYSAHGILPPDDMPPALRQWLQAYQREIGLLREAKGLPAHAEWYAWENNLTPKDNADTVAPLLSTLWDQTYPYNGYCPGGSAVGCAATAQAQVMNYWHYPAFGTGSHSYTHPTYGLQSADFAHTLYDWGNMPAQATYYSPLAEKEAVATLMYHCGVSLDMDYDPEGSAAAGLAGMDGISSIDNSLKDYFGYSTSMRVVFKFYGYTNEQWRDMLMADLDLGHPIVYTGQGSAGGHGFVCDGYDSRGYMHFNFGWSGRGDGYFPVDSISPGVGGVGGGSYSFNDANSALLNLVPDYRMRVSDSLFSVSRDGRDDSLLFCINDTANASWSLTCDADWVTFSEYDILLRAGWLFFHVAENNSGQERVATITFTQGSEQCVVRVVQDAFSAEDLCPVTVVMEATHGDGWQGDAYLSLQSEAGFVYGTARLENGTSDSVSIPVAPTDLQVVWHTGGGTDRYVNYTVKNRHGQSLVSVRNAYRNGGSHHIANTCDLVGIEDNRPAALTIYPNPASDVLHVQAEGFQRAELMDMSGRTLITATAPLLDLSSLSPGAYFLRIITTHDSAVRRFIKK